VENDSDLSREIGADFRQSSGGFEGGSKDNKFTSHNDVDLQFEEDDFR
jgi:hypothetical protein